MDYPCYLKFKYKPTGALIRPTQGWHNSKLSLVNTSRNTLAPVTVRLSSDMVLAMKYRVAFVVLQERKSTFATVGIVIRESRQR